VFTKDFISVYFITKSGEMSLSTGNGIIISFSNSFMARRSCIDDVIIHSFSLMSSDIAYINYIKKENGKLFSLTRASLLSSLKIAIFYRY